MTAIAKLLRTYKAKSAHQSAAMLLNSTFSFTAIARKIEWKSTTDNTHT